MATDKHNKPTLDEIFKIDGGIKSPKIPKNPQRFFISPQILRNPIKFPRNK
jgi:hypothetical protein